MAEALQLRNINQVTSLIGLMATASFETTGQRVTLNFDAHDDIRIWIDGREFEYQNALSTSLPAGRHTIVLQLNPRNLPLFLRSKIEGGTFLAEEWETSQLFCLRLINNPNNKNRLLLVNTESWYFLFSYLRRHIKCFMVIYRGYSHSEIFKRDRPRQLERWFLKRVWRTSNTTIHSPGKLFRVSWWRHREIIAFPFFTWTVGVDSYGFCNNGRFFNRGGHSLFFGSHTFNLMTQRIRSRIRSDFSRFFKTCNTTGYYR